MFCSPGPKLKDFKAFVESDEGFSQDLAVLRQKVEDYAKQFPTIGFEKGSMVYQN